VGPHVSRQATRVGWLAMGAIHMSSDSGNIRHRRADLRLVALFTGTILALAVPLSAHAAMENRDTGETCRGIDCQGFNDPPPSGSSSSGSSSTTTALDEVINCDSTQEMDIRAVAWNIADDWANFDYEIERQTSFRLGNCTRDRFSKNGKVECMNEDKCKKNGDCRSGYSLPWTQKIKIYPNFLNQVAGLVQADRRACYAALITHEFAHSCDRFEGRSEAREDAAFDYWRERFPGSSGLDIIEHCELD
jgi:hypothetical protein